jgi:hypothetical protein
MRSCKGFVRSLVASAGSGGGGAAGGTAVAQRGGGGSSGTDDGSGAAALLPDLMSALLSACDNAARSHVGLSMRQRCAECLGLLGAVDPAKMRPGLSVAEADHRLLHRAMTFLVTLVTRHLVRILETSTGERVTVCWGVGAMSGKRHDW